MKNLKSLLLFFFFSLNVFSLFSQNIDEVLNSIDYENFYKHLSFLAGDELKGRDVGSEGFNMAADYVVNEFKNNNIKPFGDNGTYFQKIEFVRPSIISSSVLFTVENKSKEITGKFAENITILPSSKYDKYDEKSELVFVGFGNIIKDKYINDYEGVDVNGKIVIVSLGGPKDMKDPAFDDFFAKINNAKNSGAIGIILFYPGAGALQGLIFKRVSTLLTEMIFNYKDASIKGAMFDIDIQLAIYAKRDFIKDILKQNDISFKKEFKKMENGENCSKELNSIVNVSFEMKNKVINCKNVVGILPGSDSVLKNEYVVIGAHLDHLGVGKPVKGDSIYNGMWDNASGSAAVLSIAKAFNEFAENPKRTIIFICYTAEEKGLLGSNFYAQKNNVKDGKIVAVLNIDMVGSLYETTDIVPLGYNHSNLSEAIDYAAEKLNLKISDSKKREDLYLERSDQISFIKKGIPALNIGQGTTSVNPDEDYTKELNNWWKNYYHEPSDDLNQKFSEQEFLTSVKTNFLTLYYISNILEEVKWNKESKFYEKYVLKTENK
ncbi:MAG: M28 family peptidase [Bacteroidales bacterium]|nr:M28 family peptidase [Bacteroidales bacterium]